MHVMVSKQAEVTEVWWQEGDVSFVTDVRAPLPLGVSFLLEWFPHYREGGVKPNLPRLFTKWGRLLSHRNITMETTNISTEKSFARDKKGNMCWDSRHVIWGYDIFFFLLNLSGSRTVQTLLFFLFFLLLHLNMWRPVSSSKLRYFNAVLLHPFTVPQMQIQTMHYYLCIFVYQKLCVISVAWRCFWASILLCTTVLIMAERLPRIT